MKECSGCKKSLSLESFAKTGQKKNEGRRYRCNDCRNKKRRENRKKNKEKFLKYERQPHVRRANRNSSLLNDYGITIEQYEEMAESQSNLCMICKNPESHKTKKNLTVDHCHKTNKVRGLLCHSCNCAIGLLKDDIKLLSEAINYLQRSKDERIE